MNVKELIKDKHKRALFFAKVSVPYNTAMAAVKIFLGIFTGSVFLSINSLYNIGMGLIRVFAIKTNQKAGGSEMPPYDAVKMKYDFYMTAGGILTACSAVYMVFSARLFIGYSTMSYSQIAGIAIAAVTFTEIAVAARGIVAMRYDHRTVIEAIKLVNLACALISLVLTQTALLSFAHGGDTSIYNGVSGMIFGSLAALIGLYMVVRAALIKRRLSKRFENGKKAGGITKSMGGITKNYE